MNIYCRKNLIKYIQPAALDVFAFTAYSLLYYGENFGVPYMFTKLDAVLPPEYTGAMEYPGAVLYTEKLFPRRENTEGDVGMRGLYVMHEVAHMWFGDAVSVKWWNDLWLKESFADYVAFTALKEARDGAPDGSYKGILGFNIPDSMMDMFHEQLRGYKEDMESTSHPIAGIVDNTQAAENVFDGISYAKGAGVLKQLVFLIGREHYTKAMKAYFEKNLWGNTELKHLMDVYNDQLGALGTENPALDISRWNSDWLGTPGTNCLELKWTSGNSKAVIVQTAVKAEYPTLRYHKIRIGFYNAEAELIRT
jgi:aminopeptidase N